MEEAATNFRQGLKWTGGLLVAWLLLLPAWAAGRPPVPERQAYFSCAPGARRVPHPDCSSTVYHQKSMALVSPRTGFSFVPSLVFLPGLPASLLRVPGSEVTGRLRNSFFCFGFLRPIFEHQIAINAP